MNPIRRSCIILLLLPGCHAAPTVEPQLSLEDIAALFRATPIDTERLKRALEVQAGDLRLIVPTVPSATFEESLGEWFLENVGTRRLVLPRWQCDVRVDYNGFLLRGGRCGSSGGWHRTAAERPRFDPEHWLLLEPGRRIPLPRSQNSPRSRGSENELEVNVCINRYGPLLCRYAEDFNRGKDTVAERNLFGGVVYKSLIQVILPKLPWSEKLWAGEQSVAVKPDASGKFHWSTIMAAGRDRTDPLPMEGYLSDYDGRIVFSGALTVEGHRTTWIEQPQDLTKGTLLVATTYALPGGVPPGNYLLLTRARNAWDFFYEGWAWMPKCTPESQFTAVSTWMPVTVP